MKLRQFLPLVLAALVAQDAIAADVEFCTLRRVSRRACLG